VQLDAAGVLPLDEAELRWVHDEVDRAHTVVYDLIGNHVHQCVAQLCEQGWLAVDPGTLGACARREHARAAENEPRDTLRSKNRSSGSAHRPAAIRAICHVVSEQGSERWQIALLDCRVKLVDHARMDLQRWGEARSAARRCCARWNSCWQL